MAVASAIKITPVLLLVYWAITGRWRAVGWTVAFMAGLAALSVLVAGRQTNLMFLAEIHRISNVLLVAWNNESLAALIEARHYGWDAWHDWTMHVLPPTVKWLGSGLAIVGVASAACLRRGGAAQALCVGAALIAVTAFSPIAWSHYYVVLLVPALALAQLLPRQPWVAAALVIGLGLAYRAGQGSSRPIFLGAMVLMLACLAAAMLQWMAARRKPAAEPTIGVPPTAAARHQGW